MRPSFIHPTGAGNTVMDELDPSLLLRGSWSKTAILCLSPSGCMQGLALWVFSESLLNK